MDDTLDYRLQYVAECYSTTWFNFILKNKQRPKLHACHRWNVVACTRRSEGSGDWDLSGVRVVILGWEIALRAGSDPHAPSPQVISGFMWVS